MKINRMIGIGVAVVLVGIVAVGSLGSSPESSPRTELQAPKTATAPRHNDSGYRSGNHSLPNRRAHTPISTMSIKENNQRVFAFEATRTLGKGKGNGAENVMNEHLRGEWVHTLVATEPGYTVWAMSIQKGTATVVMGKGATQHEAAKVGVDERDKPILVRIADDGKIVGVVVDPETNSEVTQWLRTLAAASQLVLGQGERWTTELEDTTGRFQATYERAHGGRTIVRTRNNYTDIATDDGFLPPADIGDVRASGTAEFRLGTQGKVEEFSLTDTITHSPVGGTVPMVIGLTLTARLITTNTVEPSLAPIPNSSSFQPLATVIPMDKRTTARVTPIPTPPMQTLISDLRAVGVAVGVADDAMDARRTLTSQVVQALENQPASASVIADAIDTGELDGTTVDYLLAALGATGSPQAQEVLAEIVDDADQPLDTRIAAATHLGSAKTPTPEGMKSLTSASEDTDPELKNAATLALGSALKATNGTSGDTQNTDMIAQMLTQLARATTPEEKTTLLMALGNSGAVQALDGIVTALFDESEDVRGAAAFALRWLPTPAADEWLTSVMAGDPSPMVRLEAVSAASWRQPGGLSEVVIAVSQTDPHNAVRTAALSVLATWKTTAPGAADALAWAQTNDPDAEVRLFAAQLLSDG